MRIKQRDFNRARRREFNLFLQEICGDLCLFRHVVDDDIPPEKVKIHLEANIGISNLTADIRVRAPGRPPYVVEPYFVEIKYGYPQDLLVTRLCEKYGKENGLTTEEKRLVVVTEPSDYPDWSNIEATLRNALSPNLELEIWDEDHLLRQIRERFSVDIGAISQEDFVGVRQAIENAKWRRAFVDAPADHHLAATLLWHFGFWTLNRLYENQGLQPEEVLEAGRYENVAVLMADLCGFSSYVRATRDEELVRHSLTSFYSKARHVVHNNGGMVYQFIGDEVVGLFGLHNSTGDYDYVQDALDCANALVDIGNRVSSIWQRELDFVQEKSGVHIGISIGDLELMRLRPFSHYHIGFAGDALNLAARSTAEAGQSEIVVTNNLFQHIRSGAEQDFLKLSPVDVKSLGPIQCWMLADASKRSSQDRS